MNDSRHRQAVTVERLGGGERSCDEQLRAAAYCEFLRKFNKLASLLILEVLPICDAPHETVHAGAQPSRVQRL